MKKHYHLIGIGGIGMSALARILLKKGDKVTGSDKRNTPILDQLQKEGAKIQIGHNPANVGKPDAIVYSTDIPTDNLEYQYAKKQRIPLLHRSELLAQMLKGHAPLLVTGTHGKTTTASLLAHVLLEAGLDPSFALGGYLNDIETNGRYGRGLYFAIEADESDGTFLNYPSFASIITNLEHDHMNFWKTEEALLEAFSKFADQTGSKKHLFWCGDDPLLKSLNLDGYSYGFGEKCDLVIDNFMQNGWEMIFDLSFRGKHHKNIKSSLIGAHNVLNAAAVFGLGRQLDIDENILRKSLMSFRGVGRRLEKKGGVGDIQIFDDYAHHPTEIFATLRALKHATPGKRVIVAYQPHRYSRTKYCLDDYAEAFESADQVILTDIYAASEVPLPDITPQKVLERIKKDGYQKICFVERENLTKYLSNYLQPGDILITMGAGDITSVGPALLDELEK